MPLPAAVPSPDCAWWLHMLAGRCPTVLPTNCSSCGPLQVTIYSPARTAGQQGISQTAIGAPRAAGLGRRLGCCSHGPWHAHV